MKVVYNTEFGGFSISRECAQWMSDHGSKECWDMLKQPEFCGYLHDTPRHDILLVMAVEALGLEVASGDGATLALHELTSDRYLIDEYDGVEYITEPHTVDWTVV